MHLADGVLGSVSPSARRVFSLQSFTKNSRLKQLVLELMSSTLSKDEVTQLQVGGPATPACACMYVVL